MNAFERLARMFKVLSVDTRLAILDLLKKQPLCVGALAARLNVTQGAVSQHLRVLRSENIVNAEKHGYYVHYSLNEKTVGEWRRLSDSFLSGPKDRGKRIGECETLSRGGRQCATKRRAVRSRKT